MNPSQDHEACRCEVSRFFFNSMSQNSYIVVAIYYSAGVQLCQGSLFAHRKQNNHVVCRPIHRTWHQFLAGYFIPPNTDGAETHRQIRDPKQRNVRATRSFIMCDRDCYIDMQGLPQSKNMHYADGCAMLITTPSGRLRYGSCDYEHCVGWIPASSMGRSASL